MEVQGNVFVLTHDQSYHRKIATTRNTLHRAMPEELLFQDSQDLQVVQLSVQLELSWLLMDVTSTKRKSNSTVTGCF